MNSEKKSHSPLKRLTEAAILAGALVGSPDAAQATEPAPPPVEESSEISYVEKINLLKEYVDQNGVQLPDGSKMVHMLKGELMLERGSLSWQDDTGIKALSPDVLDSLSFMKQMIGDLHKTHETGELSEADKQIETLKKLVETQGETIRYGSIQEKIFRFAGGELVLGANGPLQFQPADKPGSVTITNNADLTLHPNLLELLQSSNKQ